MLMHHEDIYRGSGKKKVLICEGTGCCSSNSHNIRIAIEEEIEKAGISDTIVDFTGCHGFCQQGPIVVIEPEGTFYTHVQVDDAHDIVYSHLKEGKTVDRLFYIDPVSNRAVPTYREINFYKKQKRIILRNCGRINPERIEDYMMSGGYKALADVLSLMSPDRVIEEIKLSGLRGRGGAGFSTGKKWEFCRREPGTEKYLICNADEGDPGAFMDRSTMEGDPHTIIE